jgi:copper homeostasis protein
MRLLLEVIVQTVDDVRAAEAGGADRLEVVRDITRDGLTPSIDVVRAIQAVTRLPLRVMVRESDSFTVSGAKELAALRRAIEQLALLNVDGVVLGFARGGALDLETTRAVLAGWPAVRVTFHRAFDVVHDPIAALDALREIPQIDRVLTSGGTADWKARCEMLKGYAARAGPTLTMLAGGASTRRHCRSSRRADASARHTSAGPRVNRRSAMLPSQRIASGDSVRSQTEGPDSTF